MGRFALLLPLLWVAACQSAPTEQEVLQQIQIARTHLEQGGTLIAREVRIHGWRALMGRTVPTFSQSNTDEVFEDGEVGRIELVAKEVDPSRPLGLSLENLRIHADRAIRCTFEGGDGVETMPHLEIEATGDVVFIRDGQKIETDRLVIRDDRIEHEGGSGFAAPSQR
ncbi:MAG: hypothetical protein RL885_10530 [Planctomycetota bacterium]